jgi:hypothetical protein
MPTYWSNVINRREFVRFVTTANPHFERILTSSIRPLVEELKQEPMPQTLVWQNNIKNHMRSMKNQVDGLYRTKANKYKDALYHIVQTGNIPNLAYDFTVGGMDTTRAYRFAQTNVPATFNPAQAGAPRANVHRIVPASAWVNPSVTVEDYVARGNADGIFVIHMQGNEAAFKEKFDGWTSLQHMNSVLRVAKRRNVPIYELNMRGGPNALDEVNNYTPAQRTTGLFSQAHSGQHAPGFRAWLGGKGNVVVMGFDATVCVDANLFGSNDPIAQADGVGPSHNYPANGLIVALQNTPVNFARPLVSVTNVVTSRALVATTGSLNPPTDVGQYGNLTGLG